MAVTDRQFWIDVAEHPAVAPHVLFGLSGLAIGDVIEHPSVQTFRAEHGGYLFVKLDGLGRVFELHSMFTPEGWGREALLTAKAAFASIFETASLVVTYEVSGNWRSRPPKSFGFTPAGEFADSPQIGLPCRTWVLTSEAWNASPARRRQCQ